jgi:hypothetical protein
MRPDDLDQAEKTSTVTTLHDLGHNLISAFISELCFILSSFKAENPGCEIQYESYNIPKEEAAWYSRKTVILPQHCMAS